VRKGEEARPRPLAAQPEDEGGKEEGAAYRKASKRRHSNKKGVRRVMNGRWRAEEAELTVTEGLSEDASWSLAGWTPALPVPVLFHDEDDDDNEPSVPLEDSQGCVPHSCSLLPEHEAPPFAGAGEVHVRVCVPPPHEHEHVDHEDQLPLVGPVTLDTTPHGPPAGPAKPL